MPGGQTIMGDNAVYTVFLLPPAACFGMLLLFVRYHRRRGTPAGWGRLVVGNLIVLALLLTLGFLAGETYYRFIYDTTDSIDYTKASVRWFRRYFVYNSAGFRDNIEYSLKKAPGKRRITFLGDSFTVGHGIKCVDDRFANRIRLDHPEWEVNILAKLGLDTGPELRLLNWSVAQGYQLDQVVLVYCLNDVADLFPGWNRKLSVLFTDARRQGWLCRNSYFVSTLYYHYLAAHDPEVKNYFHFVISGYRGSLWKDQQARLTFLRDFVRAHGGRLLVVTFPFFNALGPHYEYRFAHQDLDQFWKKLNVPQLDLLSVYSNLPPSKLTVNRYDAHPNEYAHALAAAAIEKFLVKELDHSPPPQSASPGTAEQPDRVAAH